MLWSYLIHQQDAGWHDLSMPLTCFHFARGLLPASGAPFFTMWQLHLKRKDSLCKNSASKQIRPEPLKRSGWLRTHFRYMSSKWCNGTRKSALLLCSFPFVWKIPCMNLKWACENEYPNICLWLLYIHPENNWKKLLILSLIVFTSLFVRLSFSYESPPTF